MSSYVRLILHDSPRMTCLTLLNPTARLQGHLNKLQDCLTEATAHNRRAKANIELLKALFYMSSALQQLAPPGVTRAAVSPAASPGVSPPFGVTWQDDAAIRSIEQQVECLAAVIHEAPKPGAYISSSDISGTENVGDTRKVTSKGVTGGTKGAMRTPKNSSSFSSVGSESSLSHMMECPVEGGQGGTARGEDEGQGAAGRAAQFIPIRSLLVRCVFLEGVWCTLAPCHKALHCGDPRRATPCYAALRFAVLCCATLCCAALHYAALRFAALCCASVCCAVLCCAACLHRCEACVQWPCRGLIACCALGYGRGLPRSKGGAGTHAAADACKEGRQQHVRAVAWLHVTDTRPSGSTCRTTAIFPSGM